MSMSNQPRFTQEDICLVHAGRTPFRINEDSSIDLKTRSDLTRNDVFGSTVHFALNCAPRKDAIGTSPRAWTVVTGMRHTIEQNGNPALLYHTEATFSPPPGTPVRLTDYQLIEFGSPDQALLIEYTAPDRFTYKNQNFTADEMRLLQAYERGESKHNGSALNIMLRTVGESRGWTIDGDGMVLVPDNYREQLIERILESLDSTAKPYAHRMATNAAIQHAGYPVLSHAQANPEFERDIQQIAESLGASHEPFSLPDRPSTHHALKQHMLTMHGSIVVSVTASDSVRRTVADGTYLDWVPDGQQFSLRQLMEQVSPNTHAHAINALRYIATHTPKTQSCIGVADGLHAMIEELSPTRWRDQVSGRDVNPGSTLPRP